MREVGGWVKSSETAVNLKFYLNCGILTGVIEVSNCRKVRNFFQIRHFISRRKGKSAVNLKIFLVSGILAVNKVAKLPQMAYFLKFAAIYNLGGCIGNTISENLNIIA